MLKYLLLIVAIAAVSAHASEAPVQNVTTPQNATAPPATSGFEVNTSIYQIPDIVDKKNNTHADPCHCVKHPCDCLNNTVTVQIRSDVVGGGSVKVLKNLSDPASVVAPSQNKSSADAANPLVIQKLDTTPAAAASTLTYSPPIAGSAAAAATTGGVPTASLSTLSTNNGGILNPNASYLYTNVDVKAKVDAAVAEHVQRKAAVTSAITQTSATAEDLKAKLDAIRAKIADVQAQTRGIKENVKQVDQVHEKKKRRVIRKISATRETLVQETTSHTQALEVARRNLRKELKASREAREVALRQAEASKAAIAAAKAATAAHGGRAQRLKAATAAAKRAADQADLQQKKIAQRQREKQRKFEQAMKNEQIKAELMEKAHEKKIAAYKQKLLLLKQSLDRVRKHVQDHKRVKSEVELKLWKAKHLAEKRKQRLRRMRDRLNKKLVRLVKRISFHRNEELSHRQQYQRKLQQIKFFLEHMKTVSADNGDELKRMKVQLHKLLEQARTLKNLQVNDARHAATLAQLTGYQTAEHRLLTVENLSQLASVKAQVHNIRHSAQQNYVKLRAKALSIWRSKMVSLRHAFQKLIETRKRILKEQKQHRKLFKTTAKLNRKIINGMRHLYFLRSKLAKQKRYAYWRMRFNKFRAHLEWLNRVRNKYREALKLPAVPMDLSKIRVPADRLKTYRQSLEHLNGKIKLASQQFRASRKALANAQSLRAFNSLKGQFLARYRYFRRLSDERNHILREMGRAPKHFTASSTLPVPTLVRKNKWRLKFLNKTINSLTRYMRRLLFQGRKTFRRSLWERTKKAYDNARVRLLSLHRKRVSAQRKLHVRRTQLKVQHYFPPFAGRFMEKAHKFHTDQANIYYSRYVAARKTYFRLYRSGRLGSWQSGRLSSFSVRARNGFARYVFHRRSANRYAKRLGLGQKPIVAQKKLPNWRARYRAQVAKYRASAQKRQLVQSKRQRAALTSVWKRREAAFKKRRARYNRRLNKRAARYRKALRACKTPSCRATYKARLVRINRNRRSADRIFRKHWSKFRGCVSAKCRVARNKKLSQRLKRLRSKVRRVRKIKRVVFNKAKAKAAALKRKQRAALRKKRRAARRQKRRLRRLQRRINRRRRKALAKKRRRGGRRRRKGGKRRRRRGGRRRRRGGKRRRRRGGRRRRRGGKRRRRRGGRRRRRGGKRRRRRGGRRRRRGGKRRRRRGGRRRRRGGKRRRRRGGRRRRRGGKRRRRIARRRAKKAARRRRRIARKLARRRRIAARKASRASR